ncbi:LysR substrate-binding domain-containing protein [Chachezhania sediminis]|uniref:LysR substrate-binding domain-containing protein n=1 Tax=Chachezhania sediminis TaxID=2599291 RepID=UPI00131BE690|nr:LysR substrate-binding domain-containing protein [Chachezhania sediminis]
MSRLPPLKALRVFEVTARQGSMTRAAQELHVTHSAVSHQITTLEDALGVRLFDRVGRRLKLTSQGLDLLPAVTHAFEAITSATERMGRPVNSGKLSIACMPALLSFWIMPRLGEFTSRYPGIRLTFDSASDQEQRWNGGADIQIVYGERNWTGYWFRRLSDLALFPVVSPTLMNNQPIRTVGDLGKQVILHADEGREWRQWLASADALSLPLHAEHAMGDARLAIEAAVHGHGIAMGDSISTADLLARGQLVAPFRMSVPAANVFYIACRSEVRQVPVVNAFTEWMFDELEREPQLAPGRMSNWPIRRSSSRSRSRSTVK